MLALLVMVVILLVTSRRVFTVRSMPVDESLGWWAAFAVAITGTAWSAFQFTHRHMTMDVFIVGAIVLGIAAIAIAAVLVRVVHAHRRRADG